MDLALQVPAPVAERARIGLRAEGSLDPRGRPEKEDGLVFFAVRRRPSSALVDRCRGVVVERVLDRRTDRAESPYDRLVERLSLPPSLEHQLPWKWELLGDVLLLKLPLELMPWEEEIAQAYAKELGAQAVVAESFGITGPFREPHFRRIWGTQTETIHKENDILYKLDVLKVMFSSGNQEERLRMAALATDQEVVVDLFAGIGYFTIPLAKYGHPSRVIACEVNDVAVRYLRENLRLNRVRNVEVLAGDFRNVAPEGVADRVLFGYLHGRELLPHAFACFRGRGILHYHEATPSALLPEGPIAFLHETAANAGYECRILRFHDLKSYAPGVRHVVIDAEVIPRRPQ